MTIYSFNSANSPVEKLTVRHTDGGGVRAYIQARGNATPDQLDSIKHTLTSNNMQWTPIQDDGSPALEIRGIGKNEVHLMRLLDDSGAINGGYKKEQTTDDQFRYKDKFKNNTLRASGLTYFVGDAGFLSYGWKTAFKNGRLDKPPALLSGIFYALGTPFIAIFGRGDKSDLQFRHMSYSMIHEMEDKGIEIPKDASVRAVAHGHNTTIGKKVKTFLARYPSEICNSLFGVAGGMIIWDKTIDLRRMKAGAATAAATMEEFAVNGLAHGSGHSRASIIMDMGLGAMTIMGGLVSLLVEEEPRKPGEKRKHGLAGAWEFVKEKPLRTAGLLFMGSTLWHAGSTAKDWKDINLALKASPMPSGARLAELKGLRGALPGRALFVVAGLAAETLMAISSKGHGNGVVSDKSLDDSAYAVAADLVYHSPEAKRDMMFKNVTTFLEERKHLAGDRKTIEQGVRTQLAAMQSNPWVALIAKPAPAPEPSAPDAPGFWQDKLAVPSAAIAKAASHQEALMNREDASALNRA